jgi:ATP-dependent RNA helicase DeaD
LPGFATETRWQQATRNGSERYMASFEELGLRDTLLRALEDADVEQPTALQEAVVPVLRREGNVVARASSGSGKTLAYALGVLDRIEPRGEEGKESETGTRLLVLAPTPDEAERVAMQLVPFVQAAELSLAIPGGGWGTPLSEADVVVATPVEAMRAVRSSGLKLEGLEALVLDGASDLEAAGGWDATETLFDHVPRDAQRVVVSSRFTDAVDDLIARRVKRALRWPPQPAVPEEAEPTPVTGVVGYVLVSEREKTDVLARLLGGRGEGGTAPVVVCRTDERAANLAEALSMRGFVVGGLDDPDADVAIATSTATLEEMREESGEEPSLLISFDVPADERTLRGRHGGETPGYVFAEPRELRHLRDIAERAGLEPRPAGVTGESAGSASSLRAFRDELRRALAEEDLGAQMLVLEPLFDEFTAAEVAAAAAALLRRKVPAAPAAPVAAVQAPAAAPAARPAPRATQQMIRAQGEESAPAGGRPAPFTRLFVGVGERDGVRAGDLVGAIAGETGIPGSSVGKIEIRDTFSIVEVPAEVADRVIRAINGTTLKGRSVRVDYDRGADRARRAPAGGGFRREGGSGFRSGGTGGRGPASGGERRGPSAGGRSGPRPGGPRRDGGEGRPPRRPRDDF